jgi:integrase
MPDNPARWTDLKAIGFEAPPKLSRGNYASLPYSQLPAFIEALREQEGVSARALELLIVTNVRTNAVRKARRDEFDLGKALWTVPLVNMKDRKHRKEGFRVPLPARAVEIVKELLGSHESQFLFPSYDPKQPLSDAAMLSVIRRMNNFSGVRWVDPKYKPPRPVVPHGFRASFRTWAEETTGFPHAIVEQAMGHRVATEVERSYIRTDMLDKRRQLMNAWASYIETRPADNIVPLTRPA